MKRLLSIAALVVVVPPAVASDATHRLWGTGPAFWEIPCGLPCFAMAEAAGIKANEVSYAELNRVQTLAGMQALLDARNARLAAKQGSAASGSGTPVQR